MKKLAIGAVVVAVVLAVILGLQINQKNTLEAEVKDLRAASANFEAANEELETVKASLEEAQAQMEALSEERTTQTAQLAEAQQGIEEALAQVTSLTEERVGLMSSLDTGKETLEQLTAEKEALEQQVADLNKAGENAAAQLEAAQKEAEGLREQMTQVEARVAEANEATDAVIMERDALTKQAAELEQQVANLTKAGEEAAAQLEAAQKEAEALRAQAETAEEAKLSLEGQQLQTAEVQEGLAAEKANLEAEITQLKADAEAWAAQRTELEEKATALEKEIAELKADAEAVAEQRAELETRIGQLEEEGSQLKAKAEEDAKKLADLEAEYKNQVDKVKALEQAAVDAQAQHQQELEAAVAAAALTVQTAEEPEEAPEEEPVAAALEPVTIQVFHTNDVHSRVEGNDRDLIGYAKVATLVKQAREQGPTLLLDAGDVLHGMSFSTALQGESMVKMMNLLGYDAMTPGNHDFNYGYDRLLELQQQMDFPVVNANIVKEDGTPAFDPYVIKEIGGKKIALVGVGNPQMESAIHPDRIKGMKFEDHQLAAQAVEQALSEEPDAVIILAHWGADDAYDPNSSVLAQIPGVNLVIDGHSHTHYADIRQVEGGALIVSAHEYLKTLGHLSMHFDEENNVTIDVNPIFYEATAEVEPDEEVANAIAEIKQDIEAVTSEVVGKTNVRLEGDREVVRTQETNLGNLAADALRLSTEADFAITNGGGIRTSVEVGDITKGHLIEVFPFGNSVVLIEVRGAQLLEALEHGLRLYPEQNGGFPQISGGKVVFDPAQEAGHRVVSLEVDGKEVDPNGTYLVTTNDFMAAGGDDYLMFKESPVLLYGGTLDEALIDYIQSLGEVNQEVEGRIQLLEGSEEVPEETEEEVEATEKPAA